jgi:hypothetical protein
LFALSPLITIVEVALVPVRLVPPSLEVHVESNEVIVTPLSEPGVMARETVPADVMETSAMVGTLGGAAGVTESDAAELLPGPARLVAATTNVYGVRFVRPVIVHSSGPLLQMQVRPSGEDVTVYPVTAEPPSDSGTAHVTLARALPRLAATLRGAPGTVRGVTLLEAEEEAPVPAALVAVTVKV